MEWKKTRLKTDAGNLILLQRVVLNDIRQRATLHVLHRDPQLDALQQIRVQEVDDIRMAALLHDQDLIDDELLARLGAQIHLKVSTRCCKV